MAADEGATAAKAELSRFLIELEDLLEGALEDYPELFGAHSARLQAAWPEAKARSEVVRSALAGQLPDDKKLTAKQSSELDERLTQHGLTGEQLALKLELFRSAAVDFLEELPRQAEAEAFWSTWIVRFRGSSLLERILRSRFARRLKELRAAGRALSRGLLKRPLDIANVVVDSLALALAFLPGVGMAAGAFGEFKKAAELSLGEPDEDERPKRRRSRGEETNTAFGRLRSALGL